LGFTFLVLSKSWFSVFKKKASLFFFLFLFKFFVLILPPTNIFYLVIFIFSPICVFSFTCASIRVSHPPMLYLFERKEFVNSYKKLLRSKLNKYHLNF